jgi:hypothetical protein
MNRLLAINTEGPIQNSFFGRLAKALVVFFLFFTARTAH